MIAMLTTEAQRADWRLACFALFLALLYTLTIWAYLADPSKGDK